MDVSAEIKITEDNTELIKQATKQAVMVALEAVGLQAERYAKRLCPLDTGLLRNSITHAVGGASFSHAYKADKATSGGAMKGGYSSGTVGSSDDTTAYVGTPVEYASYVEYGTSRTNPHPYIKPAVEGHTSEYKKIFEEYLKRA